MRYALKNLSKGMQPTDERIAALHVIGLEWTMQEHVMGCFDGRIQDIEEYRQMHGLSMFNVKIHTRTIVSATSVQTSGTHAR